MTQSERQKLIERCLDDGGRQVDGLNEFATSADQRAITVASVYIGAATALVAGLLAWTANSVPPPATLLWAGIVAATVFYIGASVCLWTAFPQITFIAGNPPDFWRHHLTAGSKYEMALETQIDEYETKIAANSKQRARAARLFKWGALLGAAAPALGLITFWVASAVVALCP